MEDMTIREVTAALEQFAPLALQEGYDNSGLVVGDYDRRVRSALLCVDVTDSVLDEARELGAELVISHHPLIFHPLKRFNGRHYVERLVERALREGVALYACHTNLDSAPGGMSYRVAEMLGIGELSLLSRSRGADEPVGFGVVGSLPAPMAPEAFLRRTMERLSVRCVRHSDFCLPQVGRVALCTGSGASLIAAARERGAELYIAADFRYNDFMEGDGRMIVADIGHFESEYCAINLMFDIIRKKIPTFALHKSVNSRNPINYLV